MVLLFGVVVQDQGALSLGLVVWAGAVPSDSTSVLQTRQGWLHVRLSVSARPPQPGRG